MYSAINTKGSGPDRHEHHRQHKRHSHPAIHQQHHEQLQHLHEQHSAATEGAEASEDVKGACHGNICKRMYAFVSRAAANYISESDQDEGDYQPSRYKPESLDALCQRTKFSRKELQLMYRGFKQECPAGIVNEEMFTDIYAQFFPQGDSSSYARYVFNAFDKDRSGSISFDEFVVTLSTLCRGTLEDKLRWAFALYDVNGDGIITHDEMVQVVASIYEMMGSYTDPAINDATVYQHVDSIYAKVGSTADGHRVMTWEQFYDLCQRDERVLMSIAVFDTVM